MARLRVARSERRGPLLRIPPAVRSGRFRLRRRRSGRAEARAGVAVSGAGSWLAGTVVPEVAEVELRFADGSTRRLRPTQRVVLAPVAREGERRLTEVVGFDSRGAQIARQPFRPFLPPRAQPGAG